MKFKTYSSENDDFSEALKEIKSNIKKDFKKPAFLFLGLHPKYDLKKINKSIKSCFSSPYVAFHAINLFSDRHIVKGVVAGVFEFEKKGGVNIFSCSSLDGENLRKTAEYLNSNTEDTHIIIASLANEDFSFFIEKLSKKLDYYPIDNIIGGISSGEKIEDEIRTYQFVDGEIIKNGFVIVSFKNVKSYIDISLGFTPYGITYEITKCDKNKIYFVDEDKSFVKLLRRLLDGIDDPKPEYLWHLPINIIDDKNGYVSTLRTVERLDKDYVKLYGPVKKRQKFKLSFATKNDLIKEDEKISKRLSKKMHGIEAAFNFSCVARQYILNDKQETEIKTYVKNFDSNLFGFFTFGEIGPDKMYKNLRLYNETSLMCIMKEL